MGETHYDGCHCSGSKRRKLEDGSAAAAAAVVAGVQHQLADETIKALKGASERTKKLSNLYGSCPLAIPHLSTFAYSNVYSNRDKHTYEYI